MLCLSWHCVMTNTDAADNEGNCDSFTDPAVSGRRQTWRRHVPALTTCTTIANSSTPRHATKSPLLSNSLLSTSQSYFHHSPPASRRTPRSDAAATDPKHTVWLWKNVISTSTSVYRQRWQQTSPAPEFSSLRTRREAAAKVADTDFMELVLEPYGITIQNETVNKDLYKYFHM